MAFADRAPCNREEGRPGHALALHVRPPGAEHARVVEPLLLARRQRRERRPPVVPRVHRPAQGQDQGVRVKTGSMAPGRGTSGLESDRRKGGRQSFCLLIALHMGSCTGAIWSFKNHGDCPLAARSTGIRPYVSRLRAHMMSKPHEESKSRHGRSAHRARSGSSTTTRSPAPWKTCAKVCLPEPSPPIAWGVAMLVGRRPYTDNGAYQSNADESKKFARGGVGLHRLPCRTAYIYNTAASARTTLWRASDQGCTRASP